jgi:hypothetical protein
MTTLEEVFASGAGLIACTGYIPYAVDIVRGRVKPARSARLMLALLLCITILQQRDLHSGWLMAMTVGEIIGSFAILGLAVARGVGGLTIIDRVCYALLAIDVLIWLSTRQTVLALCLSIVADLIAFSPTLIKTWRQPWTETPLFYIFGVIAPPMSIIASGRFNYSVLLFPLYLMLANVSEVILIFSRQRTIRSSRSY